MEDSVTQILLYYSAIKNSKWLTKIQDGCRKEIESGKVRKWTEVDIQLY